MPAAKKKDKKTEATTTEKKFVGRGGPGRGGGRPKGSKNRNTNELERYMNQLLDEKIAAGEKDVQALELLQTLYKSRKVPFTVRQSAMKAALPYEAAKYQPLPPPPTTPDGQNGNGSPLNEPERMSAARDTLRRKLIKTVQPATGRALASQPN